MKYLLNFSYDGSNFNGYQKQKDTKTVESSIETILSSRFNKDIKISASGRTDKGVHAYNQYATFEVDDLFDKDKLLYYLNKKVEDGIVFKSIKEVPSDFHARFSAKSKTYMYVINTGKFNVFKRNYELQYCKNIDLDKLNEVKSLFIGKHDFENFTTIKDKKESYVREIFDIKIVCESEIIRIYITGSGFLRYMVRNIVGSIISYENGRILKSEIEDMINKKINEKAVKVPACGLYLYEVTY